MVFTTCSVFKVIDTFVDRSDNGLICQHYAFSLCEDVFNNLREKIDAYAVWTKTVMLFFMD